ncbi:MAG: hypothetical protein IKW24_01025, partial [Clostridia bacterium]|nr:hypothetical protein [Clostridia bacterium]
MKKLLALLLAALMLTGLFACGEYHEAVHSPQGEQTSESETQTEQPTESPEVEGYSVTLTYNGKVFTATDGILAQWTDGYSFYTASFEGGVAKAGDLDGDYRVTLSAIPEGFTYDPNKYTAKADAKAVEIELYRVEIPRGAGSDEYHCITLKKTNYYRAEFARAEQMIFFEFVPTSSGNTEKQLKFMRDFGTEAIVATPSYCMYLAEAARGMADKYPMESYKLKYGI